MKRSGRSFKSVCPFHDEKTPSFHVFPESQLFKCFGCGISGSVYTFLMNYEHMDFPEAVNAMADRAGIPISYKEESPDEKREKDLLYSCLREASYLYHKNLINPESKPAETALEYALSRGIKEETIKKYQLGYAHCGWDFILRNLRRDFKENIMEKAGLIIESRGGGYYDFFRDRLMIPIFDIKSNVIAFGGRKLDTADFEAPKFINTKETPLHSKGKVLYLLNIAKHEDSSKDYIIVVEGYIDALIAHQEGFKNVVATIGISFTQDHALLLKKYTGKVLQCFDPDRAGIDAAIRSSEPLTKIGLSFETISLPAGKDPDDFIREYGADAFQERINQAKPIFEFVLEEKLKNIKLTTADSSVLFLREMIPFLKNISDPVTKAVYVGKLAKILDVEYNAIADTMRGQNEEKINLYFNKTEELEQHIAIYLIKKPAFRPYLKNKLSPNHFNNLEIKALFAYLTSEEAKEDKAYSNGIDEELPLLIPLCTENLPQEIIRFAQKRKIPTDESKIYALISRVIRTSIPKTEIQILAEHFLKHSLKKELEEADRTNGKQLEDRLDKYF